jgi:hypothetical protein
MKLKEKVDNLFFEDNNEYIAKSVVNKKSSLIVKYVLSLSVILNIIMNVLYMNFICYRTETNAIGIVWLLISLIWSLVSLVVSYKLADDVGNNIFYFNVILIYVMSKLWFVFI